MIHIRGRGFALCGGPRSAADLERGSAVTALEAAVWSHRAADALATLCPECRRVIEAALDRERAAIEKQEAKMVGPTDDNDPEEQ